jgi:peptidoglycan/LPS O-acetylase OafA/YrhL
MSPGAETSRAAASTRPLKSGLPYVFGLDLMRATAITLVVCSHIALPLGVHFPNLHLDFLGVLGVELFFVLSGFLIGRIITELGADIAKGQTLLCFLNRRWFRTLPLYYLFLVLNIALSCFVSRQIVSWPKFILFVQSISTGRVPFFSESWSLCIEEWSYLSLPLLILLLVRSRVGFQLSFVISGTILILLAGAMRLALTDGSDWDNVARKAVCCRLDAIVAGALAGLAQCCLRSQWNRFARVFLPIGQISAATALALFFRSSSTSYYSRLAFLPHLSSSLALTLPFLCGLRCPFERALGSPVRTLARLSYSIYLSHIPIGNVLLLILGEILGKSILLDGTVAICYVLITLAVSGLLYQYYERYFLRIRERVWQFTRD